MQETIGCQMTQTSWGHTPLMYHWACVFARVDYCASTGKYMYWRHRHPVKCFSGIFNQKQLILFQFNLWTQLGDFCSWINLFGLTELLCALSMSQPHKGVLCVNLQGGGRRVMEVQSKLFWKIQHQGTNGKAERVPNLTFHSPHQKCFSGGWGWKNIWILANKIEVRMMGLTFLYMC